MVDIGVSRLPFHDFALLGTERPQSGAHLAGEPAIESMNGFALHQLQMAMKSAPQVQSVRLHAAVAKAAQHAVVALQLQAEVLLRFHGVLK